MVDVAENRLVAMRDAQQSHTVNLLAKSKGKVII